MRKYKIQMVVLFRRLDMIEQGHFNMHVKQLSESLNKFALKTHFNLMKYR